ncbi:MAG: response regulator transcription factor, partial [Thermoanaerobaculia bacterium]
MHRVIVLDDDESIGRFVKASLKEPNYRTAWYAGVDEAIAAVDVQPPDLAFIDIGLTGEGSGWDLLRHLRSRPATGHIPIVMLTGSADTLNRAQSLKLGADRYLIKPVAAETLKRVANEMLGNRDDLWWSLNLRKDQIDRMRELFFDATTELPTIAVVVNDLRRLVDSGETLQVFCVEIEPLFRIGERNFWDMFDLLRTEFVRGLHVMVTPILGNDVMIATSHSGANDFYCFARNAGGVQMQTTRNLERTARAALRAISVASEIVDEVMVFAGGAT